MSDPISRVALLLENVSVNDLRVIRRIQAAHRLNSFPADSATVEDAETQDIEESFTAISHEEATEKEITISDLEDAFAPTLTTLKARAETSHHSPTTSQRLIQDALGDDLNDLNEEVFVARINNVRAKFTKMSLKQASHVVEVGKKFLQKPAVSHAACATNPSAFLLAAVEGVYDESKALVLGDTSISLLNDEAYGADIIAIPLTFDIHGIPNDWSFKVARRELLRALASKPFVTELSEEGFTVKEFASIFWSDVLPSAVTTTRKQRDATEEGGVPLRPTTFEDMMTEMLGVLGELWEDQYTDMSSGVGLETINEEEENEDL